MPQDPGHGSRGGPKRKKRRKVPPFGGAFFTKTFFAQYLHREKCKKFWKNLFKFRKILYNHYNYHIIGVMLGKEMR